MMAGEYPISEKLISPTDASQKKPTLRPYQIDCIQTVLDHIRAGKKKALIHLATGTGKTLIAAVLIDKLSRAVRVNHALFLVDRIQLAVQAQDTFQKNIPHISSYILRPGKPKQERRITIALLQNLISRYREYHPKHFDLIFVDECHRSIYGKWRPCLDYFDSIKIGLTATPSDRKGKNTYEFFDCYKLDGKYIPTYCYPLRRGIEQNYLAPYKIYRALTRITKEGLSYNGRRYKPENLEHSVTVPDRNRKIVREVERISEGKTLVYAVTKKHASLLAKYFNELHPELGGRYAESITTDSKDPQSSIRRFKNEYYPLIAVSVGMLDTGFDCPQVRNIVMCRPTRSEILYKQVRGRGTRLCEGKSSFTMLDFVGNSRYFNEDYHENSHILRNFGKKKDLERRNLESQEKEILVAKKEDSWLTREWVDIGPRGEKVDLRDYAFEVERIASGLVKAHPTYERLGASEIGREEMRQFVRDLSSTPIITLPWPK